MRMMKGTLGIGFVGAGGNTKLRHLPGFKAIDGVRLVAVANRSEASSRKVADAFGIEHVLPDWRAVVDHPEVDAVCIGTWPNLHAEVTIAAIEAGKHVLTEARMADTLANAEAMLAASKAHPDRVAQIVPSPFTLDLDSMVMEILKTGELGDIREIFIDHATAACLDPDGPLTWRQDPRCSGINMLTMGIYHEVIIRWFHRPCAVLSATGEVFTKERPHWETGEPTPVGLPDCLHIHGRMGETLLNYHFSGIETGPPRNGIRLVGSGAALRVDVANGVLYRSGHDGTESEIAVPEAERRGWRVEADFVDSIRTGKPVELTSFEDGLAYMRFTDAVHGRIRGG